jgi:metallophosphoesterase (TIGR00282 family)
MGQFKVLFIADVVGKPGRYILSHMARRLKYKYRADFVIANTENAAGGFGITPEMARKVFTYGVDCQTSGNHVWDRIDIIELLRNDPRLIRPANYPDSVPGYGHYIAQAGEYKIAIISLMGRTYMYNIDCPFRTADRILESVGDANLIIVDMHAEATSEKQAMAYYLDGRVTAVIGTHTHVQTADDQISENGTAYITDVGMTGAFDSILGMKKEPALGRFLTGMPKRLAVAENGVRISGAMIIADPEDGGQAVSIERFCLPIDLSMPIKDPEEETADAGEANRWQGDSEEG